MITDFIKTANGRSTEIELPEKVYNIMGDYPETIAEYVVPKIIKNEKRCCLNQCWSWKCHQ